MLPVECNMPDLSLLRSKPAFSPFILHQLFGSGQDFPEPLGTYRRNFVRLADKAVRDYTDVRQLVIAQLQDMRDATAKSGRAIYMIAASDRLEDCILTVARLHRYFERVRRDKAGFPVNRSLQTQVEHVEQAIRDTRNLIEHLDKDISDGRVSLGVSTAPVLDATTRTIVMADSQLPVTVLSDAVTHFYDFAQDLARYRRRSDGGYEKMPRSGRVGS